MDRKPTYEELEQRVKRLENKMFEHKQTEESLKRTKKELEIILDSVPALITFKDTRGRYIRINKAYADSINFLREEIVGKTVLDILPDREFAGKYNRDDQEVITSGIPKTNILEPAAFDPTRKVLTDKVPCRDEEGNIIGIISIATDITSRLEAEKALKESEKRYRTLVENVPVAVYRNTIGPKGKIVAGNPAYYSMFGFDSEEEFKQFSAVDFYVNPEERKRFSDSVLSKGRVDQAEIALKKRDGTPFWGSVSAMAVYDEDGKAVYLDCTIMDITDRKQAEEELLKSEELNRVLVETASDSGQAVVIHQDIEGIEATTVFANDAVKHITGYTGEELMKLSWFDILHPAYIDRAKERYRRRMGGEDIRGLFESFIFGKDGTEIPIEASSIVTTFRGKNAQVAFFRDITERKRTEEELRESEGKYRYLAEISPNALVIHEDNIINYVNPAAVKLFRVSGPEELLGRHYLTLVHPDDRAESEKRLRKAAEGGLFAPHREHRVITKDGHAVEVESTGTSFRQKDKIIVQAMFTDITERKRAEEALRESEEKYRITLQSIPDSVCITRQKDGLYFYTNDGFSQISGYSREEAEGKSSSDLNLFVNHADRDQFIKILREKGEVHDFEFKLRRKDGSIFEALLSARSLRYGEEDCMVTVVRDITPIKKTEQEKVKLQVQFQHAQRMESIGTLAGGLAHNFNNLLMGIMGNTSIMLLDIDPSHPHHGHLKNIEKMIKSGSQVTKQLLGYAREGRYEVKPISLNQIVKETSDTFGTTRKEIRVYQELADNLLGINADLGQIEQVLMNLYVNAVDAMPEGGDLFLKTMNVTDKDMAHKAYKPKPGNYVMMTVRDTGLGMDKKTMERIFDPFFTTKGLAEGTGLGLASAYGIIKGHGGYIDVDSEKGKGTTFEIYLPATEEEAREEEELPGEIVKGKETVLLVDDEEMVLDTGGQMLKKLGYEALLARSGHDALELYKKNRDRIDMVLLDMVMPEMGGGKTFDRLKKVNTKVKVLLSSGYSIDGRATEILKRGCNGFIQKPFNMQQLSQSIRKILDHK